MIQREPGRPRAVLACDHFIRYETGLAQGLRANGWEPILLGRDHDHAFGGEPGAMRGYVQQRLGVEQPFVWVEGRARNPSKWASTLRARSQVRRLNADVTHVQYCVGHDPRLTIAAGLRPRRFAITLHDIDTHPGDARSPFHHHATVLGLMRAAGVVFVHADRLRDDVLERGLTRAPVVVVPHGIDEADPQPLPAAPSLLFFGRIVEYKGLSVLLDALTRLWRRRPETTLTIAGEGRLPGHPGLRDKRVRLLHRHIPEDELPELFAAASVVVLPYLEASQSGVGSLAKGHGRPLVASAVGGLPELVSDGSGLLVPPADPDALADALDGLLGDRALLERMGNAGLWSLHERSGWPVVGALTVEAYARYLGVPEPRLATARA
ncbi:MAG: glycosyltransferase family 4 protein [Solirubrobacteraceae bacterium]